MRVAYMEMKDMEKVLFPNLNYKKPLNRAGKRSSKKLFRNFEKSE
jgi:hypothetical protein